MRRRHVTMRDAMIYVACVCASLFGALVTSSTVEVEPQFEAAFQGRCGRASPCEQLCRELHDGTYECGCKEAFVLHVNGYSCHELNDTAKSLDNYVDSNEDVLYQKDASFSAELDTEILPKDNDTAAAPEGPKKGARAKAKDYNSDDSSQIAWTDVTGFNAKSMKAKIANEYTIDDEEYSYNGNMYKELKGLNSLISEGLSNMDINLIKDLDKATPQFVTTLGPSLEQKVPSTSTHGPRTTEISPPCGLDCAQGSLCYRGPLKSTPARCLCPLGKGGSLCGEDAPAPTVPSFSGSRSWLAIPALRAAYKRVRIRLRFLPSDQDDSIVLLTGERDDMTGDYLAVLIKGSRLEFRFDCGSGAGVLRSSEPVLANRWNTIYIYRHRWDAWMRLNTGKRVRGRSKGLFSRMTFREPVWLGGAGNTTGLDQKLSVSRGFKGCLHQLKINGRLYSMRDDAVAGFDVGQCASQSTSSSRAFPELMPTPQARSPPCACRHGGSCVPSGCLCPLGYKGARCESVLDMQIPKFNGSSYLRYLGLGNSALSWLEIQITLKPTAGDGLLMYNSHQSNGLGDFFALYLRESFVEFAFDLGTGIAVVRSARQLKLDSWHDINLSRTGRLAMVRVDDSITTDALTPGSFTQLSLAQNLYLGGIPDYDVLDSLIGINSSFNGCIKKVVINDLVQQIVSSALGGVNVDECPNSACMGESCQEARNYSSTDKGIASTKYSKTTENATRFNLTNLPTRKSLEIHNSLHINRNYTPSSIHHSAGAKKGHRNKPIRKYRSKHADAEREECETNVAAPASWRNDAVKWNDFESLDSSDYPHFYGTDSYIHIQDTDTIKQLTSCALDINIRFLIRNAYGLLVWSGRNEITNQIPRDDFFSLGVEDGYLTFRYNLGSGQIHIVANQTKVNDGLWHRAKATRGKQAGFLEVDGLGLVSGASPGHFKQLHTNTGLYIGGMPSSWQDPNGVYFGGIHGCISRLTLSSNSKSPISLQNLGDALTHNVGKCDA